MLFTSLNTNVSRIKKVLINHNLAIKYLSDTKGMVLKMTVSNIQTVFNKIKNTSGFFNTLISTFAFVNTQKMKNINAIHIIGSVGIDRPNPPATSETKNDKGTKEHINKT